MVDFNVDLQVFQKELEPVSAAAPVLDPTKLSAPVREREIVAPNFEEDVNRFNQERVDLGGVSEEISGRVQTAQNEALKRREALIQEDDATKVEELRRQAGAEEGQDLTQIEIQPLEQGKGSVLSKAFKINTGFGQRSSADVFSGGINYGTDFNTPSGTKVSVPAGEWEVVKAFANSRRKGFIGNNDNQGYGNSVLVKNTKTGEQMRFSHLSQVNVRPGQIIRGGQVFGKTGSSGNVTGPHLDLEYYNSRGKISDVLRSPYRTALFGR